MDWEMVPADGGSPIAPPVRYRRLEMLEDGRLLDVLVDLNLAGVPPGEYTLRLTAENLLDHKTEVRAHPISLTY